MNRTHCVLNALTRTRGHEAVSGGAHDDAAGLAVVWGRGREHHGPWVLSGVSGRLQGSVQAAPEAPEGGVETVEELASDDD